MKVKQTFVKLWTRLFIEIHRNEFPTPWSPNDCKLKPGSQPPVRAPTGSLRAKFTSFCSEWSENYVMWAVAILRLSFHTTTPMQY